MVGVWHGLFRAQEVKEHPFFKGIDWTLVYLQKYPPPLIPPKGEVNAADAFDIGSFDEEDTKGIKVKKETLFIGHLQPMNISTEVVAACKFLFGELQGSACTSFHKG